MKQWWFLLIFFISNLNGLETQNKLSHRVVVSIAPYRYFVEKIADKTVEIQVFVPIGASFHDYEPTPKQVFNASGADLWFRIGESFEGRVIQALQGHQMPVRFIDLRQGVELIYVDSAHQCCCHANGADLHIWLSPKEAKVQAKTIADTLIQTYPENKELYEKNVEKLLKELDQLEKDIQKTLEPLQNRIVMVGHPAYGYFMRDYRLTQLPIECEGKDPTPRQLTTLLKNAREANVKTIFTQKQYGEKAVRLMANELGAKIVVLDPYSDNYFVMMREIADRLANQ